MTVHGYILINGDKWRVTLSNRKTHRSLKPRDLGPQGTHLQDVQAFLEQSEHRWLLEPLRYGTTIHLPGGKA